MIGLVEQTAQQLGWRIALNNVIVEGTSDVEYLRRASELHEAAYGRPVLDADFAVVAAGLRDDGGVDGVNRRLSMMRQLADVDRDESGAIRHRFIGLLDNDKAGRRALSVAKSFDRRVEPYEDLFLLHPVMPIFAVGVDRGAEAARINATFHQLDWEIEDLCSQHILTQFEREFPRAVQFRIEKGGKVHRELAKTSKFRLRRLFVDAATIADAREILVLLKALRSYFDLNCEFIVS